MTDVEFEEDGSGDFTVTIAPDTPRRPDCPTPRCLLPAGHTSHCLVPNR